MKDEILFNIAWLAAVYGMYIHWCKQVLYEMELFVNNLLLA